MVDSLNIYPLIFLIAALLSFTLPGVVLLEKTGLKINSWEKIIVGTTVGLIAFTLISYLLIVINMTLLLIPMVVILDVFALRKIRSLKSGLSLPNKKHLLALILVFGLGIIGQMAIIAPSGVTINGDLVFWSAHGHDSMWHIALMEELKKGYPLQNPVFAGERLVNYHFFSDVAPAMFSKYFYLPNIDLYFRYFPFIFSLLLGSLAFLLGRKIGNSFSAGVWAAIFTYFAGSFGYILTWMQSRTIGGESVFWATQIQSSIGNPPQITAFVIVLAFLYLFLFFLENQKNKKLMILCAMLAGSLAVFKVYGGVVVLGGLLTIGIWQLIRERSFTLLLLSAFSGILAAILYLPNSIGSTGFLIWEPWWFIRTMVVVPERLNLLDWELKRQTYIAEHNLKRVAQLEGTAFLIFLFGNLGMRFVGIFNMKTIVSTALKNYFHLFLFVVLTSSFIFPMLFLQKGVASNSIQFMQYFLLLMGIIAGITVSKFLVSFKTHLQIIIGFLIIAAAIPTQVSLIADFYSRPPVSKISNDEQLALKFINEDTPKNSIIMTSLYDKHFNQNASTPHIWDWFDTSYVSAMSSRRVFLSDSEQVDIMGYNLKSRARVVEQIFQETDTIKFIKSLKNTRIDYLYFPKPLKPAIDLEKTSLKQIFSNSSVELWKVN